VDATTVEDKTDTYMPGLK